MDDDIKKMEGAAMAAYMKDIQNNADLTSQNVNNMLAQLEDTDVIIPKTKSKKTPHIWQEIKKDDESSYYWNTVTNETTWDPPDDYLSIAQQEEQKQKKEEAAKVKQKMKEQKEKEAIKEVKAHIAREKMRELAVNKNDTVCKSSVEFGPAPKAEKPYGSWTPVVKKIEEKVDLQLPKPDKELPPPPVVMEPERIRFKEKRIVSLGDGPVEFKKRKGHCTN